MHSPASRLRLRSILRTGLPLALIALAVSGCMLPVAPKTEAAKDVFNLYVIILIMAGVVFVGVEGFLIYAIFRYRRRPGDDTLPEQLHGNNTVEIIWTAIPTVIVLALFVMSMVTLGSVNARAENPLVIQVEGSHYPGASIRDYYDNEWQQWQESVEEDPEYGLFQLDLAPDRLHKDNVSGGGPYGLVLPDGCADGLFVAETTMPFVDYLNLVFSQGGFPWETGAANQWRITKALAKDLLPL